jgi:hypothetical protein
MIEHREAWHGMACITYTVLCVTNNIDGLCACVWLAYCVLLMARLLFKSMEVAGGRTGASTTTTTTTSTADTPGKAIVFMPTISPQEIRETEVAMANVGNKRKRSHSLLQQEKKRRRRADKHTPSDGMLQ